MGSLISIAAKNVQIGSSVSGCAVGRDINNLLDVDIQTNNSQIPSTDAQTTPHVTQSGRIGRTICANDLRSNMPQNFASLAAIIKDNARGGSEFSIMCGDTCILIFEILLL